MNALTIIIEGFQNETKVVCDITIISIPLNSTVMKRKNEQEKFLFAYTQVVYIIFSKVELITQRRLYITNGFVKPI